MLSKIFRRRQPTASPSPPFEPSPTSSQPGDSKTPSRFIRKIRQIKNALRPKSSNRKERPQDNDQGSQKPQKNHKQSLLNEGFGNFGRAPLTAEDTQFKHRAAIVAQQNPRPSLPSIVVHPPTATPTPNRAADPRANIPVSLSLAPLAEGITTLEVEAELLAIKRHLKQLRALESDDEDEEGEIRAMHSRQTKSVATGATPTTQRPSAKPAMRLPAKTQPVSVTETRREKTAKQRIQQGNKWWEMGGNLSSSTPKRHCRKDAMDFGNPHTGYRNIADFTDAAHSLQSGRPNQRNQQPYRDHPSNQAEPKDDAAENAPIDWKEKIRQYYLAGPTGLDSRHGQTSTITEAAQVPNVPVGVLSLTATQDLPLAARQPLRMLDLNLGLNGGARVTPQADVMEEFQDEGSGSNENRVRASNSNPPQGFERVAFPRRRNRASAQF